MLRQNKPLRYPLLPSPLDEMCSQHSILKVFSWSRYQARIEKHPQQERESQQGSYLCFPVCASHTHVSLSLSLSLSLVSLIRGQVVTMDGTPLVGVNVSFVKYPKYGYTITRQDGT
jgi:hypothetical protein